MKRLNDALFIGLALVIAGYLLLVVIALPQPRSGLGAAVAGAVRAHDLPQPVTAVLLVLRGYDTWLEVAVMFLTALAVLSLRRGDKRVLAQERAPALLLAFGRWLLPGALLVSGYLFWRGTNAPGGAFQAGAILAAALVLLDLSGLQLLNRLSGWPFRLLLALGFALPALLTLLPLLAGAALLTYPAGAVGPWVLVVEFAITLSVALILIMLFLGSRPAG